MLDDPTEFLDLEDLLEAAQRASLDEGEAFVVAIAAGHLDISKIAETSARWTKDFDR